MAGRGCWLPSCWVAELPGCRLAGLPADIKTRPAESGSGNFLRQPFSTLGGFCSRISKPRRMRVKPWKLFIRNFQSRPDVCRGEPRPDIYRGGFGTFRYGTSKDWKISFHNVQPWSFVFQDLRPTTGLDIPGRRALLMQSLSNSAAGGIPPCPFRACRCGQP